MKKLPLQMRVFALALIVYVGTFGKHQIALADTETDCSTDLDQANEHYDLSADVVGDCVVTANGITIDGLGQYSITGNVAATGANLAPGFDVTLENLILNGEVHSDGGYQSNAGTITISSSTIHLADSGTISSLGGSNYGANGGNGGNITITDSTITGDDDILQSDGGYTYHASSGSAGDITITDSDLGNMQIEAYGGNTPDDFTGGNGGTVSITRSKVGNVFTEGGNSGYYGGNGGNVTIDESNVSGLIETYGGSGDYDAGRDGHLVLVDRAPTITVDPTTATVAAGASYDTTDGVTAEDYVDGDLTENIQVSGSVGTEPGDYVLTYSVNDNGLSVGFNGDTRSEDPETATATRTVTREGASENSEGSSHSSHSSSGGSVQGQVQNLIAMGKTDEAAAVAAQFPGVFTGATTTVATTGTSSIVTPIRDLQLGMSGEDVRALQKFLNQNGFTVSVTGAGSAGQESDFFGQLTRDALARYQAAKGIIPAVGYFGPITQAYIKASGATGAWW